MPSPWPAWPPLAAVLAQEATIEYRVSERDTLIGLSETVFIGPQAWREIARLNRPPDPNLIRPGQVLRVPARLMRMRALPVRVSSAVGEVRVGNELVQPGAALAEGQSLQTRAPTVLPCSRWPTARGCACRRRAWPRSSPAAAPAPRRPMRRGWPATACSPACCACCAARWRCWHPSSAEPSRWR